MITFCIPTWNRADKLRVCLDSIIKQIGSKGSICIYNNASTDHTEQVIVEFESKYPEIVSHKTGKEHFDFAESFRNAFNMPTTEYTWMFGDDDILVEDGFNKVVSVIKNKGVSFIHAAESSRVKDENRVYYATTKELCYGFGFLDITGFISGNIFKTKEYKDILNGKDMDLYSKSSFPQSMSILDAFSDHPAAFINSPIVDNQELDQSDESLSRWASENIHLRYAFVSDGILRLVEKDRIDSILPTDFFRYLTGNIFGKILYNFYSNIEITHDYIDDKLWDSVLNMTELLCEEEMESMKSVVNEFRENFDIYVAHIHKKNEILQNLQYSHDKSTKITYPFSYI